MTEDERDKGKEEVQTLLEDNTRTRSTKWRTKKTKEIMEQ